MTPVPVSRSLLNGRDDDDEEEQTFSNAKEFFKDLDHSIEHLILDCFQLNNNQGRDPRACHSFYQFIQNRLQIGVTLGFLQEKDFMFYWQRYDGWVAAAVEEYLKGNRRFPSNAPVIPSSGQAQHQKYKRQIQNSMKTVFIKARYGNNQYNLADLKIRLEFFERVCHYSADVLDHYWHRLLFSPVDQMILYVMSIV